MKNLIRFINQYTRLDQNTERALRELVEDETYIKNQYLLREGQVCTRVWFIQTGSVRKFYLHEGKEITSWIHFENEMFTSLSSYFQQKPSEENLQACENTKLLSISYANSLKLNKYPQMSSFSKLHIEEQFSVVDSVTRKFSQMSAADKYAALAEMAPTLIRRAKLGYIASIMGVSQETLSRIRAKK
jgi:CRP-like cAMP-binding protein